MNKYKKNQSGVILLLTLFILSGILVITLGAADLVMAGIKMNRLTGYSSLAFFASEAGMERVLWEARKNGYALPNQDQDNVFQNSNIGNGSAYQINYATSSPRVTFQSIGSYGGAKRSVESTYLIGEATVCTPDCSGKVCGSDGCGGSCGICAIEQSCVAGVCVVNPSSTYIIAASAGSGGSISPSGAITVDYGGNQSFIISPNSGYNILSVIVDSVDQGAIGSYTFTNVQADHSILASFALRTYAITASAGSGGSISPSGAITVDYGGNQSFIISANSGYVIASVLVDGVNQGTVGTYTFSNVTAAHTIVASFCTAVPIAGLSPDTNTYSVVVGADGKCWLDRNLGATRVAQTSNDSLAYGYYYQWGRLTDGHQVSTSGTTATNSSTDIPGHANFITESVSPYDWRVPQNNSLWQGVNGINNPCPTGFRLPTQSEWTALVTAANITNAASAFSSSLKLTVAGYRQYTDGRNFNRNTKGAYWMSNTFSTYTRYFEFTASYANTTTYGNGRATANSVRCIKN